MNKLLTIMETQMDGLQRLKTAIKYLFRITEIQLMIILLHHKTSQLFHLHSSRHSIHRFMDSTNALFHCGR